MKIEMLKPAFLARDIRLPIFLGNIILITYIDK